VPLLVDLKVHSPLQDFYLKIVHKLGNKHSNVDALSKNLEFVSNEEEDF
jgi:hypothetical protein